MLHSLYNFMAKEEPPHTDNCGSGPRGKENEWLMQIRANLIVAQRQNLRKRTCIFEDPVLYCKQSSGGQRIALKGKENEIGTNEKILGGTWD